MPESVIANGRNIKWQSADQENSWSYNGDELSANINIAGVDVDKGLTVRINFGKNQDVEINNGLRVKFKRLIKATTELKYKKSTLVLPGAIGNAVETNRKLEYDP